MDVFDKEKNIISYFRDTETECILLLPENNAECEAVCNAVLNESEWGKWIDSSAKSALPPDYYCDEKHLMMDVMRVDDHETISRKGKVVNPLRVRETEMMKELKESGILDKFPNATPQVIARTDLPTEQDHNYGYYLDCFRRTIQKHIKKIPNYKHNHPDFGVIFFVFDEASAYFEALEVKQNRRSSDVSQGYPHYWFLDKVFMEELIGSEVDYLIWFTPYKHCNMYRDGHKGIIELPTATIINIKQYNNNDLIFYNPEKMVSTEV